MSMSGSGSHWGGNYWGLSGPITTETVHPIVGWGDDDSGDGDSDGGTSPPAWWDEPDPQMPPPDEDDQYWSPETTDVEPSSGPSGTTVFLRGNWYDNVVEAYFIAAGGSELRNLAFDVQSRWRMSVVITAGGDVLRGSGHLMLASQWGTGGAIPWELT